MQRGVQRVALRRCHAAGKVPPHISAMHSDSPRIRADLEMTDALGWRMKFGVIAPSTNTVVQPEFDMMRPRGVTNHFARIHIPNAPILGDADFEKLIAAVRGELLAAVDRVMTCEPGHLIMGMSSETFWDGLEGSERLRERIEARAGVAVTMGSDAARQALRRYGEIRRIGVVTPYMPIADCTTVLVLGAMTPNFIRQPSASVISKSALILGESECIAEICGGTFPAA